MAVLRIIRQDNICRGLNIYSLSPILYVDQVVDPGQPLKYFEICWILFELRRARASFNDLKIVKFQT